MLLEQRFYFSSRRCEPLSTGDRVDFASRVSNVLMNFRLRSTTIGASSDELNACIVRQSVRKLAADSPFVLE